MRLIRTVLQPANINLSSQFQRSQVIKTSGDLHLVLIETSSLEHWSNIRWCGRSYANAASASSESLEPKNARRRVPKDVRKSMVENYVNKYRETNAGKFPTASEAMKGVGGSYYVIREILQEVKYNFKMSSLDTKDASSEKNAINKDENEMSIKTADVSQARKLGELITSISKTDKSKDIGTRSHHRIDEPKSSLHFDPQGNKQETVDEDEQKLHGSQSKSETQESTEEVSESELLEVPTGDVDHKTKSSVWQNLKSFATGILSIWKRS